MNTNHLGFVLQSQRYTVKFTAHLTVSPLLTFLCGWTLVSRLHVPDIPVGIRASVCQQMFVDVGTNQCIRAIRYLCAFEPAAISAFASASISECMQVDIQPTQHSVRVLARRV
jgi:hypothetical protein